MKRILYICTENTSLSPIAQGLTNKIAKEKGLQLTALSAGIFPESNSGLSPNAHKVLMAEGIDMSYHKARMVTEGDIANSCVVICMSDQQAFAVVSIFPQAADKIYVMGKDGINNPYGGNFDMYYLCKEKIKKYISWAIGLTVNKQ